MGTLYVLEENVYISRDGGSLKVSRRAGRDLLLERPLAHASEIVVLGKATPSSPRRPSTPAPSRAAASTT